MKTINKIAMILCLASLAACVEKPVTPDSVGPVEQPAETRTLTFVLPDTPAGEDAGLKTAWAAGDKIIVHGEYAKDQVTVTLAAGDIASDGKSATKTVEGLRPYKREDCQSTLYASYPAEAANNLKHCFFYSAFNNTNTQFMAACNEGDTFRFENLSGVISFTVEGDFDSYDFTARKSVPISYEMFQVKITDAEKNLRQYVQSPTNAVSNALVADGQTVNYLYIPGNADLTGGFILQFKKDGEALKGLTDKDALALAPGQHIDLGNLTDRLVAVGDDIDPDLSKPIDVEGNANCYVLYAPGLYKFAAVQGNSETPVGEAADHAAILWESWSNGEEVTARSVIKGLSYDSESNMMCFELPNPIKPGNALVAVQDKDDKVLWSWHIWVPETPFTTESYDYSSGFKLMSRNLGALVDTQPGAMADARSFGLLYQWGRKDPFLGVRAAGSTEQATFAGTAMTLHEGQMTQEEAAAQPTVLASVTGVDWCSVIDRMYWGDQEKSGTKTIYDPCPAGYRAAARSRSKIFTTNGSTLAGWLYDADNCYFQVGNPVSTLPIAGYLNYDGTYVSGISVVWNTHMDADTPNISYCQLVKDNESKKGQMERSLGGSIRCEAE